MTISSPDSYADAAPLEGSAPLKAGLPAMWWPCVWGLASLVYSALWMAESWRAAQPLLGPTKVNHMAQDLWCLILTIGSGCLLYQFYKRRSETVGVVLCLVVAAAAMAWHRL